MNINKRLSHLPYSLSDEALSNWRLCHDQLLQALNHKDVSLVSAALGIHALVFVLEFLFFLLLFGISFFFIFFFLISKHFVLIVTQTGPWLVGTSTTSDAALSWRRIQNSVVWRASNAVVRAFAQRNASNVKFGCLGLEKVVGEQEKKWSENKIWMEVLWNLLFFDIK